MERMHKPMEIKQEAIEKSKQEKISIRFFDDREVRAVWDDETSQWLFSVLDIVAVLRNESDYQKTKNYWKYLRGEFKKKVMIWLTQSSRKDFKHRMERGTCLTS